MSRSYSISERCPGSIGLAKVSIRPRPVSSLGLVLALSGCASLPAPLVPIEEVVKPKEIRVATVLDAARCEIAIGLNVIGLLIREAKKTPKLGDPPFGSFLIYPGTMDFSGTIKVIQSQGASISAIIPVGTSLLTPNIGYGATQTGTRKIERQFKVSFPTAPAGESARTALYNALDAVEDAQIRLGIGALTKKLDEARASLEEARQQLANINSIPQLRVDVRKARQALADEQEKLKPLQRNLAKVRKEIASRSGIPFEVSQHSCKPEAEVDRNDFISKAIIAQYKDTIATATGEAARSAAKQGEGPGFQNVKMVITTTFTVSHKPEGGIKIDAVFANPHFTSLGPSAQLSQNASDEYTIKLDFPLKRNADPAETRVVVHCKHNVAAGKTICLEAPVSTNDPARFNAFRELGDVVFRKALELEAISLEAVPPGAIPLPKEPLPADPSPVILDSFPSMF